MYERIERLREDLERARKRKAEADARVKLCESKLKEAENNQIIAEVTKLKLRPEEVARMLAAAAKEKEEPTLLSEKSTEVEFDYDESEEKEDEEV